MIDIKFAAKIKKKSVQKRSSLRVCLYTCPSPDCLIYIYNSLIMLGSEKDTICKMAIVTISNDKVVCIAEIICNDVDNATVAMITTHNDHRVVQLRQRQHKYHS